MRSIARGLLTLYLSFCIVLSPLFPALAHGQPGATPQQLPELGSAAAPAPAKPQNNEQASHGWFAADTDSTFTDRTLAAGAMRDRTGGVDEAMARAGGALSGTASGATQQWFSSHGITSALALGAGRHGVKSGSLDLLVPFYKAGNSMVFSQAGIRRANTYTKDYRNTVNLGLGYRHDVGNWLLGLNSFYDRDLTAKNERIGYGVEAWTDFLKLSANTYQPLSSWKTSPDLDDYLERPARGWDVRAEGYLPTYPQLGGKLAYEQYYGDEVSLFSGADRKKDPNSMTVGVIYNPVPLMGLNLDHRFGLGGQTDTSANLTFTYRLGEPLARQLSSDNLMASRLLERMRYDLVSRNNEIVLNVKKDLVELRLQAVISGTENTAVPLQLTGADMLQSLAWTGSAAGFIAANTRSTQTMLHLPAYNANGSNTYSLQANGIDRGGRAVTSNLMTVMVLSVGVAVVASSASIEANGTDTTTLSATVTDAQGQPVGAGHTVTWTTTAGTLASTTSSTDANGVATMVLTSSTTAGTATVQAAASAASATFAVTFTAGAASALQLEATPASITADGIATSSLLATVSDVHGNPVAAGVSVSWSTSAGTLASPTSLTDANGVATVVLTSSTTAGAATVQATSGSASGSATVIYSAGVLAAITVSSAAASITADGTSTTTLSASVEDANGNSVGAGVTVNWSTSAGTLASATSTTNANGIATVVLTSSTTAGTATVQATSGTASGSATVIYSADVPAAIAVSSAAASITADGTSTTTLSASIEDANGNSVGAGVTVSWSTSAGTLASATSTTNANGIATVVLTSSTTAGTATVQATSGSASGSATVIFLGPAAVISLSPAAASITADGTSTTTLSASVEDANGNSVGAGVTVSWSTSAGSLASATSTTNSSGLATVVLTSSTTAGTVTVQAASGSASGSATVTFLAPAAAISLSPAADSITADGTSTTTLSARVEDANGSALGAGQTVNWSTPAGTLGSATSTTDATGVATVVLTSATTAGVADVTARVGTVQSSATVTFAAGPAASLVLTAPATANINRTVTLSATLTDAHGNLVGAGVGVAWDGDKVVGSTTNTNANGVATFVFGRTTPGPVTIRATSGTLSDSITVTYQ
ncbi:Ig-like domain-containing protein [Pseudomonas turukhanskensis]|nr:invasin domain 3-containing protein [Pseudomonas turukhanskensis]